MRNRITAIVGALSLAMIAPGPADADTLYDALAAAYTNNPSLLAQRASVRATDEQVPQALSNWRPSVSMGAEAGVSANLSNTATNRRQHRDPRSIDLTVTQPLFRGGRTVAATSDAENAVQAARARLTGTEQDVLLAGVTAYTNVLRDQAVLELNKNNEQVLTRQLEATRDRFGVGEITRTDVSQSESRLATATAARIRAEGNLISSRANYRKVIGDAPRSLQPANAPQGLPTDEDEAMRLCLTNDPDVIAAEYDTRSSTDNIDEVRGELLPSVSLQGTASTDLEASGQGSRAESYEALVTLNVPIYEKGAVYSRLRAAKQQAGQKRVQVDVARRNAIEEVTLSWEALQTARAQIASFQTAIQAAGVALEGVQREQEVGSRTLLDVLDAEQELLDARVNLVGAQRDETVASYRLKAAVGQLTARQLGLNVELYDPAIHYDEVRGKWIGGGSSGEYNTRDLP